MTKKKYFVWRYSADRKTLIRQDGNSRPGNRIGWGSYHAARQWALKNVPGEFEVISDAKTRGKPKIATQPRRCPQNDVKTST